MFPQESLLPWAPPYGPHVIFLFTMSFTSFILVILITFSSPFITAITFLSLPSSSGPTTFGSFGWCSAGYCLPSTVAYEYGNEVNQALTGAMFLWPIALIFCFFTLLAIIPLLFIHESHTLRFVGNRLFFLFSANLATIIVCLAWLFSIYGWSIAHRAFKVAGIEVKLGPAIWMGLVASLCMVLIVLVNWPANPWNDTRTHSAASIERGVPQPPGNGYYHYKRTTREVIPRY